MHFLVPNLEPTWLTVQKEKKKPQNQPKPKTNLVMTNLTC